MRKSFSKKPIDKLPGEDWSSGENFGWIIGKKLELSFHTMVQLARANIAAANAQNR